jgi:hypothetical protein
MVTGEPHSGSRLPTGPYPRHNRRVPHISLVFREMWDTADLPRKSVAGPTDPYGCHRSSGVPDVRISVRGPKTMGEAHHSFSFRTLPVATEETTWPRQSESEMNARDRSFHLANSSLLEAPPSPLSSRPKQSAVERPQCECSFLERSFDR